MHQIEEEAPPGISRLAVWLVVLALEVGLLVLSQTVIGYRDEGLHLLAAQLINSGKRPYLDFFFQHPPLYAYLNALCLQIFSPSWRGPHALAALLSGGAILLVAEYVYSRVRMPDWRMPVTIAAAAFMSLNTLAIRFATISQPYAACLFFGAASFRLVVAAAETSSGLVSFCAGIAAGAAAASWLLAAPIAPVLLIWLIWRTRRGHRIKRCTQFLAGCTVPLLQLLWLTVQGPRQVFFDLVEFHLFHRWMNFVPASGVLRWDLDVLTGWIRSTQGLLLVGLPILSLTDARKWDTRQRAELYLCAWLAAGLAVSSACAHPTFAQYFILLTPFVSILAALGLYSLGSSLWPARKAGWVVLATVGLFCMHAYQLRPYLYPCWRQLEAVAQAIDEVVPQTGEFYSPYESVYFAARRMPPSGLENNFAAVIRLPQAFATSLHVVHQSQINEWLKAGRFAAVLIWADDPDIESLGLRRVYQQHREVTCYDLRHYIFWDRAPAVK